MESDDVESGTIIKMFEKNLLPLQGRFIVKMEVAGSSETSTLITRLHGV